MGTSYYVRPADACPVQCDRWVHLGKSSTGWAFMFRGYRAEPRVEPVTTFRSWLRLLDLGEIRDEYGTAVSRDELLRIISVHGRGGTT